MKKTILINIIVSFLMVAGVAGAQFIPPLFWDWDGTYLKILNNTWPLYIEDDLIFLDEIKPDGDICGVGEILKRTGADNWDCAADATGAGGSAIIFDIGDDGGNDSVDVNEIATTGDTNTIFTEPTADKILIAVGNNWPTADAATALAANPTDCAANQFAQSIVASGNLTCAAIGDADVPNSITVDLATLATTLTITDNESTAETNAVLFTSGGALIGGNLAIESDGTLNYNPSTGTLTTTVFVGALTGNSSTATALAANGGNCNAGEYALGVDASGAVESCTDATTEINSVVNALGGTNLTCSGQSCSVDDAFLVNNANDTMVGILTADGLTLGANENITLGSKTLDHDGSTFVFNDSVDISGILTVTTVTINGAITLPTFDGTNGQVMRTDGSGNLSWVSVAGGHDAVTLSGTPNYLTLSGQVITMTKLDINDDTNMTAGRSLTLSTNDVFADAELYQYVAKFAIIDPVATDDFFFGEIGTSAVTFTSIYCKTLVGTAEIDVTIAGTDINGTDISCTTSGVLDSSLGGDTVGATGEEVKMAITSVASSPTYLMVILRGTYDD